MGINIKASWFLLFCVCFLFLNYSEAKHRKKLPNVVVVGTVQCQDTCSGQLSHFVSDGLVAVKCGHGTSKSRVYQQVTTDEHGVFRVHLPTRVSRHMKSIKGCYVELVHSSESLCPLGSSATSSSLQLKATKEAMRIFSAGIFAFKPQLCNQKINVGSIPEDGHVSDKKSLLFPPLIPPIFPSPPPTFGGIPLPPNPFEPPPLLPNPFQPPPAPFFPPIPFLTPPPQPPPSIFPPIPGIPGLPPLPFLTPPPPPPTLLPPGFPPVPGLPPIPGLPGFPGIPPLPFLTPPPPPPPPPPTLLPPGLPLPPIPGLPGFPGIPPLPGIPPAFSTKQSPSP